MKKTQTKKATAKKVQKPARKKSSAPIQKKASAKKAAVKSPTQEKVILKKSPDVLARKNPDGTVSLLNLQIDSHFYHIDGLAAEFWLLIDGRKSVADIKSSLMKKHAVPEARFSKDVAGLIKTLKTHKLIDLR